MVFVLTKSVNVCKMGIFIFSVQLNRAYFSCLGYVFDCCYWMGHTLILRICLRLLYWIGHTLVLGHA